jgi:hypothetical protein
MFIPEILSYFWNEPYFTINYHLGKEAYPAVGRAGKNSRYISKQHLPQEKTPQKGV